MRRFAATGVFIVALIGALITQEIHAMFADIGLVLDPPGAWSKIQRDDPELAIYRARDVPEQLTFRMLKSTKRMDPKLRRETVEALVGHRRAAESRDMENKASFEPVKTSERDGLSIASYCAVDRATGRPFATMVLASEISAWWVFYETLESPALAFCARAEKLFSTVRTARKQ